MNTRIQQRFILLSALMWLMIALSGCGAPSCGFIGIKIDPQTATVDHTAAPPTNGLTFTAVAATVPPGCGVMHSNPAHVTWSVSDSVNASISNVHDPMNGTATCSGPTNRAATVTVTMPSGNSTLKGTAMLTCQ
jgi:hypothetical protein